MEMLVVMAIIAILASLSFVAIGASGNAAREAATKSTIRILSGILRDRVDSFHVLTASFNNIDPELPPKQSNLDYKRKFNELKSWYRNAHALPQPQPTDRQVEVFVRKAMFKELFPQRIDDLYGYNGVSNNGGLDDSPLLKRMYSGGSLLPDSWLAKNGSGNAKADSSELLYLALTSGDVYGMEPAQIAGIDSHMIGDTDADGNLEFLDGWGEPLQFYNWPTRLIKEDGDNFTGVVTVGSNTYLTTSLLISDLPKVSTVSATTATSRSKIRSRIDRDTEDTVRVLNFAPLLRGTGTFDLLTSDGVSITAHKFNPGWYHDLNTASSPLIVSAGQDRVLGLFLPTLPGASSDRLARVVPSDEACQALSDNITNLQRGPQ